MYKLLLVPVLLVEDVIGEEMGVAMCIGEVPVAGLMRARGGIGGCTAPVALNWSGKRDC
jgi:hypothetical protein